MKVEYSMYEVSELIVKDLVSKGVDMKGRKVVAEWRVQVLDNVETKVTVSLEIDEPKVDDA